MLIVKVSKKEEIFDLFLRTHHMFSATFDGFMQHDLVLLDQVLKEEQEVTRSYITLTSSIVSSSEDDLPKKEKEDILSIIDIISAIERIGDCCVALVERIEYKIREKLFFSETAVEEYENLYTKVDLFLSDIAKAIKMGDKSLAKKVIENEISLKELVDMYKNNHIDRLTRGICDARASVMYIDMLDFTKEIISHCINIARHVLKYPK